MRNSLERLTRKPGKPWNVPRFELPIVSIVGFFVGLSFRILNIKLVIKSKKELQWRL